LDLKVKARSEVAPSGGWEKGGQVSWSRARGPKFCKTLPGCKASGLFGNGCQAAQFRHHGIHAGEFQQRIRFFKRAA